MHKLTFLYFHFVLHILAASDVTSSTKSPTSS